MILYAFQMHQLFHSEPRERLCSPWGLTPRDAWAPAGVAGSRGGLGAGGDPTGPANKAEPSECEGLEPRLMPLRRAPACTAQAHPRTPACTYAHPCTAHSCHTCAHIHVFTKSRHHTQLCTQYPHKLYMAHIHDYTHVHIYTIFITHMSTHTHSPHTSKHTYTHMHTHSSEQDQVTREGCCPLAQEPGTRLSGLVLPLCYDRELQESEMGPSILAYSPILQLRTLRSVSPPSMLATALCSEYNPTPHARMGVPLFSQRQPAVMLRMNSG